MFGSNIKLDTQKSISLQKKPTHQLKRSISSLPPDVIELTEEEK